MTTTRTPEGLTKDATPQGTQGSGRPRLDFRFVLSARWLGGLAFCCLFAFACALLGQWQMDRRMEAVAEINKVLANYDEPAVCLLYTSPSPRD